MLLFNINFLAFTNNILLSCATVQLQEQVRNTALVEDSESVDIDTHEVNDINEAL